MTELVHISVRFPISLHEHIIAFKDRREKAMPNAPYHSRPSLNSTILLLIGATLNDPDKLDRILAMEAR